MTQALKRPTDRSAMPIALVLDALVGRLTYDKQFAVELANQPRETLERAGLVMDKSMMDEFIQADPDRFDRACEMLFGLVDSDFLHVLGFEDPSCSGIV